MSKRIYVKEKKKYLLDKRIGFVLGGIYAICLISIRFLDYMEACIVNKALFCILAMLVVMIVIWLNYTMCKDSIPNEKLLEKISDFNMKTNNKQEITGQRDILISYFEVEEMKSKAIIVLCIIEAVFCIVFFWLFVCNIDIANRIAGLIIDVQTIVMAFCFYINNHYRFVIYKNLTC